MTSWDWYYFGMAYCLATAGMRRTPTGRCEYDVRLIKTLNDLKHDADLVFALTTDGDVDQGATRKSLLAWMRLVGGTRWPSWPPDLHLGVRRLTDAHPAYLEKEMLIQKPADGDPGKALLIWPFNFKISRPLISAFQARVNGLINRLVPLNNYDEDNDLLANSVFCVLDEVVQAQKGGHLSPGQVQQLNNSSMIRAFLRNYALGLECDLPNGELKLPARMAFVYDNANPMAYTRIERETWTLYFKPDPHSAALAEGREIFGASFNDWPCGDGCP